MKKQEIIESVAAQYFTSRKIVPTDDYRTAVYRTIETMGFYAGNRTAVIPLETGQGKSTLVTYLMAALFQRDKAQSGSIILLPYRKACNKLRKDINKAAGKEVATAFHSKAVITRKKLKQFPILIMTHNRFLSGIEKLETYSTWIDLGDHQEPSGEPVEYMRKRLIVDESINKLELLPISGDSLKLLDDFFQEQQNREDFRLWQNISTIIREMLVVPVSPEQRNKIVPIKPEYAIPERLIEVIRLRANASDKAAIQKAFKAVMNMSIDGGMLKTSTDPQHRMIQTASYINIFTPLFTSIVLDGTARINQTYQNRQYFDVLDLPRTKSYDDVTLHIESKASGSRSAIKKDKTMLSRTIQYINQNLLDRNVLLICHKENIEAFESLPKNVDVVHWGSFNGTSAFNKKDCIVYCGTPYVNEAYYIYLYHIFSGDSDYNKNTTYKPSGKADPVMRFVKEPLYESMRKSYLATEFVQSINRGVCRNYNNTIPMHCFLPFGDSETLDMIREELPGIKIVLDYALLNGSPAEAKRTKNKKELVDAVTEVLLNHDDFFDDKMTVGKSSVFDLEIIRKNYKCNSKAVQSRIWRSPQVMELQNQGYLNITKKNILFVDQSEICYN